MEEKNNIKIKRIPIPIYGDKVELFYGSNDAFIEVIRDKYKYTFDNFDSYVNGYSCVLEKTTGKYTDILMIIFIREDVIPGTRDKIHTIHHESIHVAWNILGRVGVKIDEDNHETLTHLEGYIASKVYDQIEKWKK